MAEKICNVFISHIHEDDAELKSFKDLLARNGCTVRDASITSETPNHAQDPNYIKSQILAPGIEWAGTLVVLISPGTRDSEWVNWEIEYARSQDKRIVGVWTQGSADCDLPKALDELGNSVVVGWNADRIIEAIYGKADHWETAGGEARPEREIARYRC